MVDSVAVRSTGEGPAPTPAQFQLLVFFTAFSCLMFELILSRVANFHLDFRNSFMALPITFLGLALGSLHVHFRPAIIGQFQIRRSLWALGIVSFLTFLTVFVIFTQFLGVPAAEGFQHYIPLLMLKSAIFIVIFIVPFYVFGRILTICYHLNRDRIGQIYGADFLGAALACFVTPVLFHFVSLPAVIGIFLGVLSLLLLLFSRQSIPMRVLLALGFLLVNGTFLFAMQRMERNIEYLYGGGPDDKTEFREVTSLWNEFSRVQLIAFQKPGASEPYSYKIIHDNARSNVHVGAYKPGRVATPKRLGAIEFPFVLGMEPKNILVMFAGCGAEMISFNEFAKGKADIVGVEINPACRDIARDTPELASYRLGEFYELPNIHLTITEGRSFLENNTTKFDVIFIGSSAPTTLAFTSDTRKYMYTEQALNYYLKSLAPGGVIIFDHQPIDTTIDSLKDIFADAGRTDFDQCALLLGMPWSPTKGRPDLIFAPDGFSQEMVQRLASFNETAPEQLRYAPGWKGNNKKLAATITAPATLHTRVTDDRPFLQDLSFTGFRLWPTQEQLTDFRDYDRWLRFSTLIGLTGIAVFFILVASASRARRLPPSIALYLLLTGFCYLLVEVVFIAKLELFLQEPLISMATVVSVFLFTSGLGSNTFRAVAVRMGMNLFPSLVAVVILLDYGVLHLLVTHGMDLPLAVRLVLTVFVVAPVGWLLGMFYPYAVHDLVETGHEQSVPVTYGVSTLSSVIGATYAMTMMIKWGFTVIIVQGIVLYVVLGLAIIVYRAVRGDRALLG